MQSDSANDIQLSSTQMMSYDSQVKETNILNIKLYQNTVVVGRPGSGKTTLIKKIIKEGLLGDDTRIIWISGSPQASSSFEDIVFLFKRVSSTKELDQLLSNIEMNVTGDTKKFCIIFDDLQMIVPKSKVYCSFLANGRHFNVFCITLLQSIEFYTNYWKTIIDNTFNYILFNLGSITKSPCRILCGNSTVKNNSHWKMLAYRKVVNRPFGYILYTPAEYIFTNITGSYVFKYEGWTGVNQCLRELVGIKVNNINIILLSITELSQLLTQLEITSIYDLIDRSDNIYKNEATNEERKDDTVSRRLQEDVERQ